MDLEKRRKPFIMPIDDEQKRLGVGDLTGLVRRHLLLVITCVVLGTSASVLVARTLSDSYSARSTLILVRDDQRLIASDQAIDAEGLSRAAIETELDVMKSRGFAGQIVDKLNLVEDAYLNPYIPQPENKEESWFGRAFETFLRSIKETIGLQDSKKARVEKPEMAIQRLSLIHI